MLSREQSAMVEREVRDVLSRSQAFVVLPPHERDRITEDTTRVAAQLVAQRLGVPPREARRNPYALAQAEDPWGAMTNGATPTAPLAPSAPVNTAPWRPDERFQAEGVAAGVTQAGRMVKEVDFPAFVSSLVKGTFNAVVDASIQQMKAYGNLVKSVSMSLNEFRDQNTTPDEGRRHLVSKYPNVFDNASGSLQLRDDFDDDSMPNFQADLGLPAPVEDLDEAAIAGLEIAARTELARGRQQLLATTILMGINRIIITDGKINAKIKFDFTAEDHVARQGTFDQWDTSQKRVQHMEMSIGERVVKGHFEQPLPLKVSTTSAQSTADIEAGAKLSGEVSLNFRSETFPLERMMSSDQMLQLNTVHGGARGVPAPPPAAPVAPAAPAAPAPPAAPVA